MFARRKRKPQDEESLVPHGLIWQAMEEPAAPDESKRATPDAPAPAAKPIEMPTSSSAQDGSAQNASVPKKLGAISPPIPWPSPETLQIVKRPRPATAIEPSAQAHPVVLSKDLIVPGKSDSKPHASEVPGPLPDPRSRFEAFHSRIVERSRQISARQKIAGAAILHSYRQAGFVCSRCVRGLQQVAAKVQSGLHLLDLRRNVASAREFAAKQIREIQLRPHPRLKELKLRLAAWYRSSAGYTKMLADRISLALKADLARSAEVLRRAWNHEFKVRIRFAGQSQTRALIENAKWEWNSKREALRGDSRLWISFAMAVLSALLAVGTISVVRHYAPDPETLNRVAPGSRPANVIPFMPAGPNAAKPEPGRSHGGAKLSPSSDVRRNAQSTPHVPRNLASEASVKPKPVRPKLVRPRPHHNEDEDYVAADTYVSYGNR
jgi:hypothetical protein